MSTYFVFLIFNIDTQKHPSPSVNPVTNQEVIALIFATLFITCPPKCTFWEGAFETYGFSDSEAEALNWGAIVLPWKVE